MDKPLSHETQSQIRALCETIAQRDQLGEDVQEELRGHIEDKIVGYLVGNESLTEADALILAREHLGPVAELKAGLQAAHPTRVVEGIVRRIAIIATVSYSVQFVVTAILHAAYGNPFALYLAGDSNPSALTIDTVVATGAIVVASVAGVMLMLRLNEVTTNAQRPQRRSTALLVACAVVAAMLSAFMPAWSRGVWESLATYKHIWQFGFHIAVAAASCFTWLSWIDHAPRTGATCIAGVAAWLFAALLQPYATGLASFVEWWTIGSAEMEAFFGALLTGTDASVFSINRVSTFQFGIVGLTYNMLAAAVAFLLYRLLFYRKRSVTIVALAMLLFSVVSFGPVGGDPDFLGGSSADLNAGQLEIFRTYAVEEKAVSWESWAARTDNKQPRRHWRPWAFEYIPAMSVGQVFPQDGPPTLTPWKDLPDFVRPSKQWMVRIPAALIPLTFFLAGWGCQRLVRRRKQRQRNARLIQDMSSRNAADYPEIANGSATFI